MSTSDDLKRDIAMTNPAVPGRSVSPRHSDRSHVSSISCGDLREGGRADGSSRGATPTGSAGGGSHSDQEGRVSHRGREGLRGRSRGDNSARANPPAQVPSASGGPGAEAALGITTGGKGWTATSARGSLTEGMNDVDGGGDAPGGDGFVPRCEHGYLWRGCEQVSPDGRSPCTGTYVGKG